MTLQNPTLRRRSALLVAVFASAALTLLGVASTACAQATGSLDSTSAATAAVAAPAEQVAEAAANSVVPVEPAEVPAPSTEPQPVETPEATSVTNSARATVASAVDEPVASASANRPAPAPAGAAGPSARTIVDSVSTQTTSVVAEAGSEATIVPAVKRQVAALDESVRQNSERTVEAVREDLPGTVANVRQDLAEEISALSDRLPPGLGGASLSPILDVFNPPSAAVTFPAAAPPQAGGDASKEGPLSFLEPQQTSLFSNWNPIVSAGYMGKYLIPPGLGRVEEVEPASNRSKALLTATTGAGSGLDAAAPESRGPAPLDVPLPAPRLPGAAAPGSGDAFFVPFAALLALLALAAPASTRRLREAPDFRAPTPFVCALERPG